MVVTIKVLDVLSFSKTAPLEEHLTLSTRMETNLCLKVINIQSKTSLICPDKGLVKSKEENTLLGFVLDEQLTWNSHIDELISKMLKEITLLKAIKTYLPQCARQSFYKTLIQAIRMRHLGSDITIYFKPSALNTEISGESQC